MARVTVEDCVEVVENRFELVAVASERARKIAAGSPLTIDRDNDKNAVVALREIADKTVSVEELKESIVQQHQRYASIEEKDELPTGADAADIDEGELSAALAEEIRAFSHQTGTSSNFDEDSDGLSFSEDNLDVDD